jgi:hypothetical protein
MVRLAALEHLVAAAQEPQRPLVLVAAAVAEETPTQATAEQAALEQPLAAAAVAEAAPGQATVAQVEHAAQVALGCG